MFQNGNSKSEWIQTDKDNRDSMHSKIVWFEFVWCFSWHLIRIFRTMEALFRHNWINGCNCNYLLFTKFKITCLYDWLFTIHIYLNHSGNFSLFSSLFILKDVNFNWNINCSGTKSKDKIWDILLDSDSEHCKRLCSKIAQCSAFGF